MIFETILKNREKELDFDFYLGGQEIFANSFYNSRKTINMDFDGSSDDEHKVCINFLANLRLHNRIEKRHLKNKSDDNTINSTRIVKCYENEVINASCGKSISNILREETVWYTINGNSSPWKYSTIYSNLLKGKTIDNNNLGNFLETSKDKNFSIFKYHIFGCEAIKNPAAFIHNHMLLDLIKAKKITWENALVKQELPMTIEGAIMGSRIINSAYKEFMPHPYLYDKDYTKLNYKQDYQEQNQEKAKKLAIKEVAITKKWLEWKLGKSVSDYIITNNDDKAVEAIFGTIIESCEQWYPKVLGSVESDI